MDKVFSECGISYTRFPKEAKELGFISFKYVGMHLATKKEFPREVYCSDRESFEILMRHWNSINPEYWHYMEK